MLQNYSVLKRIPILSTYFFSVCLVIVDLENAFGGAVCSAGEIKFERNYPTCNQDVHA